MLHWKLYVGVIMQVYDNMVVMIAMALRQHL
jgi:hypothetical protein